MQNFAELKSPETLMALVDTGSSNLSGSTDKCKRVRGKACTLFLFCLAALKAPLSKAERSNKKTACPKGKLFCIVTLG